MRPSIILVACAVALAGCGEADVEMKNASIGEVTQRMRGQADDRFINPGRWEQKATLVSIDAPGMPPEAKEMMGKAMGQAQVHDVCLTEEQAKSPREDFFTGADKNCRYEHFKWGGGKIDLKLNCEHPNAKQTMELTGEYQPDSYTMDMVATNTGGGPAGEMVMKMRVEARRVGECKVKSAGQG